jgi:DNA-binding beta-propeller fold protein YncE
MSAGDLQKNSAVDRIRFIVLLLPFLISLIVIVVGACADRDRLNPLDPQNPNTLGRPTGLSVVSMQDTVELKWSQLDLRNLRGFRVYRRREGETAFLPIGNSLASVYSFRDIGASFGTRHIYRVTALARDFESLPSDSVSITPGPTFTWVADAQLGDMIKLTHDGVHEILRSGVFFSPFRLQIDEKRGYIWVIERISGELGRMRMDGRLSGRFTKIAGPADLAIDTVDGGLWVADSSSKGLLKFDNTGAFINTFDAYKKIAALALHPITSELWLLDREKKRVIILSRAGELRREVEVELQRPSDIDVDGRTGKVWIADGNRVIRLTAAGTEEPLPAQNLRLVSKLAADASSGACWLIDYSTAVRASRIVKLTASGEVAFTLEDFDIPQSLAVNPFDGSCLVADTGHRRVVRITSDGRIVGSYNRVFSPFDIDIAFLP